jgi:hypothetical protein
MALAFLHMPASWNAFLAARHIMGVPSLSA